MLTFTVCERGQLYGSCTLEKLKERVFSVIVQKNGVCVEEGLNTMV